MLPKKVYLNWPKDCDFDDWELTAWSEEPINHPVREMHSREYTDLSQVWHPASEPPLPNKDIIVAAYNDEHDRRDIWCMTLHPDVIVDFSRERNLLWAYISDLLPSDNVPSNVPSK